MSYRAPTVAKYDPHLLFCERWQPHRYTVHYIKVAGTSASLASLGVSSSCHGSAGTSLPSAKRNANLLLEFDGVMSFISLISFLPDSQICSLQRHRPAIAVEVLGSLKNNVAGLHPLGRTGFQRCTRNDFLHDGSFHEAIAPVLVMAQCFCLMPVRGVCAPTAKRLSFSWTNYRTLYCMLYILTTIVDTLFTINMVVHGSLDVRNIEPFIFHASILLASIAFLRLAAKWPALMHKWQRVERQMPPHETWCQREALARRIKHVTLVLIMLSLMEHLLSIISAIHFANYCPSRKDPIESYFNSMASQIFFSFEYSALLGWLGKIQNVLMTFGWSYMDIFVMIVAIGLSELLQRIQRSLERYHGEAVEVTYWTRTRLQYRLICDLIEEVDEAISAITMLSFANNLYFVCIQLLKSINKMPSVAHGVYFYFSLMFLLMRTLAVSLFLSEVNDRARRPLLVLQHVPSEAYSADVERFANEVASDQVALTGLKYFSVTRKLVLTVAGTILTYELVLIQFHEDENLWHCGQE